MLKKANINTGENEDLSKKYRSARDNHNANEYRLKKLKGGESSSTLSWQSV